MRLCLFCEKGRLTREHVWGLWLTRLLKAELFRVVTEEPSKAVITRLTNAIDMKARAVCKRCNGGWMSKLESTFGPIVAPLITEHELREDIPIPDLTLIATWAAKSAMVLEQASHKAKRIYTREQRRYLMENHRPPDGVAVWLARYSGPQRLHSTLKNLKAATGERVQTATVTIDNLAVQVTAGPWPTDKPFRVVSGDQKRWEPYLLQVWPLPMNPVHWPPSQIVTDDTLKDFTDRFQTGIFLVKPKDNHASTNTTTVPA